MEGDVPNLLTDDRGVWREDEPGSPLGIAWNEVHRVVGHQLDGISEVFTCVELEFEFGEYLELYGHWPGFERVVAEIGRHLTNIAPDWFERIRSLGVNDPPLEVWRRTEMIAPSDPDHT